MLTRQIQQLIGAQHEKGLYRQRSLNDKLGQINFSSNDYLSLSLCPELKRGYQEAFSQQPVGSGGSMLICGYHQAHKDLEAVFTQALGVERSLVVANGYMANLSLMCLLKQIKALAVIDKKIHASVYDGISLSNIPYKRYAHQNLSHLNRICRETTTPFIIFTESIFSMSGAEPVLADMATMAKAYRAELIVDEAHAFGLIGPEGLGAVKASGLGDDLIPLRVIPLGKAFASTGAVIAGQASWIEALIQCARPLIYSTAISPAIAEGHIKALEIIRKADDRRKHLRDLVQYFRASISTSNLRWQPSKTPIQQLLIGCPIKANKVSAGLRSHGITCLPMRPPTVAMQESGLRVAINYHHKKSDIDSLLQRLEELV